MFWTIVSAFRLNAQHQQPESAQLTLNMAANAQETLPVDELEDILCLIEEGFLEDDDELNKQIEGITLEVSLDEDNHSGFKCSVCEKVCKSRRGLTRHSRSKHSDFASSSGETASASTTSKNPFPSASSSDDFCCQKLHPLQLKSIVLKCAEKISIDECLPSSLREKFLKGSFIFTTDDAVKLWSLLKEVINGFNGDAEKFYSNFFSLLVTNVLPSKFDDASVTNTLMSELANIFLNHLSGVEIVSIAAKEPTKSLSEKEQKSLQYLSGFILHKLYSKFLYSKTGRSTYQQFISILQACKVEYDDSQTLINVRDRGGLWRINGKIEKVFLQSELLFRARTAPFKTNISCEELVAEVLKDPSVLSNYNDLCLDANVKVEKEVRMDLLEHMVTLYVRVRTFSFAKDIREKHKLSKKEVKKRSLRTEIKKASSSKD